MSTVMHPDGQEPQNTYWMRRVVVGLAALLALALLWWVLSNLFGSKDDNNNVVTANPQNPTSLAGTPTPSSSDSASATPSASTSTSPSASATTSSTPSSAASASASASGSASATPAASASASAAASAASGSASATASTGASGAAATCDPSQVLLALKGDKSPTIGKTTTFAVSFTNTGKTGCYLNLAKQPVTVAVTSGSDRIWSNGHCPAWAARGIIELEPGATHNWNRTWSTQRSAPGCVLKKTPLGAGTYVASASLAGSNTARLVMTLHH